MLVQKCLGGSDNQMKRTSWLTALGVMVKKWLGGSGLAGLIDRVDPMVQVSADRLTNEDRRPELERHHWPLRVDRRWEAVAYTNCVGAARARNICVRAAK